MYYLYSIITYLITILYIHHISPVDLVIFDLESTTKCMDRLYGKN